MKRLALLFAVAALAQCKRVPELVGAGPADSPGSAATPSARLVHPAASASRPESSSAAEHPGAPPLLPQPGSSGGAALPPANPDLPLVGTTSKIAPVRFAVIGDYGANTPAESAVATMVKGWQPQFVITLGDNNYPSGEAGSIDINIGQFYAEFIGNYRGRFGTGSAQNRFWPSPGNHDWVVGLAPYLDYFTLPGNERYYDVDLGLVHLYALDSDEREPDGITADSRQAAWLKQKLLASTACYDVVYFHHPAYSTADHGPTLPMRWPFRAWGAEVVMAGHDHTYERFDVEGIPYFVNGLGGASKYEFPTAPAPETRFRYNDEYGAMRLTATTSGIVYEFFSVDGKKRDAFTFARGCQ